MRIPLAAAFLSAALLATAVTTAAADEPRLDGPVAGGPFGMGGSDYYGSISNRMPYTRELAPQPVGVAEVEQARAARRARAADRARPAAAGRGTTRAAAADE